MRVLFAGTELDVQSHVSPYLRNLGHSVDVVHDGLNCLESLKTNSPDILVMEQGLLWGGSDGVLSWMYDDPTRDSIHVILLPVAPELSMNAKSSFLIEQLSILFGIQELSVVGNIEGRSAARSISVSFRKSKEHFGFSKDLGI